MQPGFTLRRRPILASNKKVPVNRSQRGFTLLEIVMVIVVMSGAGFGFLSLFQQSANSISTNYGIQTGIQFARECMEHVVTNRRYVFDYASVDTTVCDSLPGMTDFTRTVVITPFDNAVNPVCPTGVLCKTLEINIEHKGSAVAQLNLLLTNY